MAGVITTGLFVSGRPSAEESCTDTLSSAHEKVLLRMAAVLVGFHHCKF